MKTFYNIMWIVFSLVAVVLMLTGDNYSEITMYLVLSLIFYQYAKDE
jgi:hypothetical protein